MKYFYCVFFTIYGSLAYAQAVNDSCHQAIEIFCGDNLSVDFGGYNPNSYDYFVDVEPIYILGDRAYQTELNETYYLRIVNSNTGSKYFKL